MTARWRVAAVDDKGRVERIPYELCVLVALRDAVRRREIWVVGANRWRNPEDDLPADFEDNRDVHYAALGQPQDSGEFITALQAPRRPGYHPGAELLGYRMPPGMPAPRPDRVPAEGYSSTPRPKRSSRNRRPYAVVTGLVLSFSFFTLLGVTIISALGLPQTSCATSAWRC